MTGAEFEGVDFDLLADFVGGALDGTPDGQRVATLVAEDPSWRAAFEALGPAMAAVGGALEAFEPEPMPADLADRLDTLLRTAETPVEPVPVVPTNVVDLESRRRARRWAAPLSVAAAVLAFAGFGATWWVSNQSMDNSESTAAAGSTTAEQAGALPAFAVTSSGTDYTAATLPDAPMSETLSTGLALPDESAPAAAVPKTPGLSRLEDPSALAACVDAITVANSGGTLAVESADFARFDGTPAVVFRFSAANGVWAWAVGPDCGLPGAGADTLQNLPVR
ncbi:hypothetical protein [Actinoplanes couchii]|uniref:Transmembrane anti-sigma factor n=1 Tax=Actinoplanes couchii TaxID=403638 RepID=A0ABQ3XJI7_9ACTN|nr:hypothetical protein [Actinoplanes couchii]MDR6324344.1 hypothetical protein [Actinoplanes couchii]GID58656.1 hypothetical protein Aco03nite_070600 [Actinoplanes couchii]